MKKFLSILLALAVGFTFTFGSAMSVFAAATPEEQAMTFVQEQQKAMEKAVNDYAGDIIYNQLGYLVSVPNGTSGPFTVDTNLTKVAVDTAVAKLIEDYKTAIGNTYSAAISDGIFDSTDESNIKAAWAAIDSKAKITDELFGSTYAGADKVLYTKAFDDAKAAALATIAAINPSLYVDEAGVKSLVKTTTDTIEALTEKSKTTLATIVSTMDAFNPKFDQNVPGHFVLLAEQDNEIAKAKADAKDAIDVAAKAFTTAYENYYTAIAENTTSLAAAIADANTKLASVKANVETLVNEYKTEIDAEVVTKTKNGATVIANINTIKTTALATFNATHPFTAYETAVTNLNSVDLLSKYAREYAVTMKNMYDETTGLATYNVATVDNGVATAIEKIKDSTLTTYSAIKTWMDTNIPKASSEKADLDKVMKDGIALITKDDTAITLVSTNADIAALKASNKYDASNWSDENKTAVKAIQKDYTAKIKVAADADSVVALVKEARKAMDAYLTTAGTATVKATIDTALNSLGYKTSGAYTGTLMNYADGVAAKDSANTYAAKTKQDAVDDAVEVFYDAAIAKQDAGLTATQAKDIINANYAAALAKIDAMKSDAALKEAAKAVEDAIKALPATATLENKEDFIKAQETLDAYKELAGSSTVTVSNEVVLRNAMTRIIRLEKEAVEAAIKALPKTITVNDKAAVEAARAAADTYEEIYSDYASYGYAAPSNLVTLTTAEANLSSALKVDAAKKIAAIPETVTKDDAAAIEAARAAYDLLSETDKAVFSEALTKKLIAAEAALKEATKFTDENAKAYVQDLAVTVRTAKVGKKVKVTVNADVQTLVDNGFTVEYKFYKSTKKSSGYKNTVNKAANTYTNTNPVKGKNYYKVKLVVKNADGAVVATTPLTQCKYGVRTIK